MVKFVKNAGDIRKNLRKLRDYLVSANDDHRIFARERLRRGYNLVGDRIEGDTIFGPSRVVGYKDITFRKHRELGAAGDLDGRDSNPAITGLLGKRIKDGDDDWERLEGLYLKLCEQADVVPDRRDRKFWILDGLRESRAPLKGTFHEGLLSFHVTTRYERDPDARKACIDAHGLSCAICDFDFEKVYGEHGQGFIHVHHLRPLSEQSNGTETDPVKDLVPVCPNCHHMLHRGEKLLSPQTLKKMMN